jgi:hypothetical protein
MLLVSLVVAKEVDTKSFTFKELNLLSDDMVLKGINPKYDFYIPTLPQLDRGKVFLRLKVSPYLREDSTVSILVDDVPYATFRTKELPPEIEINFVRNRNRDFVKVSLVGNLRVSNNICEDMFSDKVWLLIYANSTVEFRYFKAGNIREFIMHYDNLYCIRSPALLPFVYQLCKYNPVPCKVIYEPEGTNSCKRIELSDNGWLKLENDILYVPTNTSLAFEEKIFPNLLFGGSQEIKKVDREKKEVRTERSFEELGFQTTSVEGVGNINYTLSFDTAKLGGLPDRLYLRLFIAHTPVHKKDNMELRIYLNGRMIQAYTLEGGGKKSFDIELPASELSYGANSLTINLANFTSSDNCFGAVAHNVLTVFGESYFYWNSLRKDPETISDFLRILNGYVALLVKNPSFYPYATRLVSYLGIYNKNVTAVDLNPADISKYDFVIAFENPKDTIYTPVDLSKGDFRIINPLTGKVIFEAKPAEALGMLMVSKKEDKPALAISYYPNTSGIYPLNLYSYRDLLELAGNTAVATKDFISSYQVGEKLRVEYIYRKGFSYYWSKYKLWIVLLLVVPTTIFLAYVYRRLTRRSAT